jgi:hypothetical protein
MYVPRTSAYGARTINDSDDWIVREPAEDSKKTKRLQVSLISR